MTTPFPPKSLKAELLKPPWYAYPLPNLYLSLSPSLVYLYLPQAILSKLNTGTTLAPLIICQLYCCSIPTGPLLPIPVPQLFILNSAAQNDPFERKKLDGVAHSFKTLKRFPYIEVLTKAHETVQYLLCPSPIFLTSLYYLGPRHTIYPSCDSNTEAGSYMFTVASAWESSFSL